MATYYEQLQESIKNDQKELDRYNLEKNALIQTRRAWNETNYKREEERINKAIEEVNNRIEENQKTLTSYNMYKNYMKDLEVLSTMYNEETNPRYRNQLEKEIVMRRNFINENINGKLPEALLKEIDNELVIDNKVLEIQRQQEEANNELRRREQEVKDSLNNMKNIFDEERQIIEENGPFTTVKELDDFQEKYMNKKIEEDKRLKEAKEKLSKIKDKINVLDKAMYDRVNLVKEARKANMTADEYEAMIKKVNNKRELDKFLNSIGLNSLVEKGNRVLNSSDKEFKKDIENKLVDSRRTVIEPKQELIVRPSRELVVQPTKVAEVKPTKEQVNTVKEENPVVEEKPVVKKKRSKTKKIGEQVPEYGYKTIIAKLVEGLEPKKKDGKRYRAANINVRQEFKNELKSGNYLYNIVHLVPAIIKLPIQLVRKISTRFTYKKDARERMETIKNRLNELPEKDLMILFKEYGNHIEQEQYGSGLNTLINERITRFANEKVEELNNSISTKYEDLFNTMRELDTVDYMIRKEPTEKKRKLYKKYRDTILQGKAKEVASLRNDFEEAKTLLSSGLHGFNENVRATDSKMSYVGKRFAKMHDLDVELLERQAKLERGERHAINEGNDEMALRIFVESESLLSMNTKIEKSIFGKRSTGKKYYTPLAQTLDYRNDPFIRDIFTTIAVVGAAVSAVGAINANKALHDKQREIDEVNANNEAIMKNANESGAAIAGKRDTYIEGMKTQNYQDSLNVSNVLERKALDQSSEVHGGWSVGTQTYYNARSTAQNTYNDFYLSTKDAIQDITTKYAAKEMTQAQAIDMLNDISAKSQETLATVAADSLPHLVNYANNHSQFDLAGIEDAMNYIVAHPTAITDMNNAMIESTSLGEEIAQLSLDQVTALNSMPSNISNSLLGAAAATSLAMQVANKVNTNNKKGKYGNKITDIVDSYIKYQDTIIEESNKTK